MPNLHIVKKVDIDNTFRVSKVMADFDVKMEHLGRVFDGNVDLPGKWQIGLICGASGTGKSTIAKELFGSWYGNYQEFSAKSVIDDMPKDATVTEIEKMFYAVGFGSVPCWLKPYSVLSNGEQMRVCLAKSLLSSNNVCFVDFTSVVDRNVAKTLCMALKKMPQEISRKAICCSKLSQRHN